MTKKHKTQLHHPSSNLMQARLGGQINYGFGESRRSLERILIGVGGAEDKDS